MVRTTIVVACLVLGACSQSFEDGLIGTWECKPADQATDAPLRMTHTLSYAKSGDLSGSILVEEEAKDAKAILRGKISGSWKYNGKSVVHTMAEEFEQLEINGKVVPEDEVSPLVLSGFRPENSYDVTVDLKDDALTWFDDAEKSKPLANCSRKPKG